MIAEEDIQKLQSFAKSSLKIRTKFHLTTATLTPLNYQEEKEKFFSSKTYNPQFLYKPYMQIPVAEEVTTLHHQLAAMILPKKLNAYLSNYVDNIALVSDVVNAIGTEKFPAFSEQLFACYVSAAQDVVTELPKIIFHEEKNPQMHTAEEIQKIFTEYLSTYQELFQYNITIDTFNDHTVRVADGKLIIGSKVKRNTDNVKRLIVHEIESHMLQRYNVKVSRNPLVRLIPYGEYQLVTEGLAVYNELLTKTITHKSYNTYFFRLEAVKMLDASFRDIFTYMSDFMTPHQAFITTFRVKRGMADTGKPGGFPKDAAYLLGYKVIDNYVKNSGSLPFLYIVRHPEYGSLLAKYNLLHNAEYVLPHFMEKRRDEKLIEQIVERV